MLKKCLRILFNIDNLIISIITTALLCGLLTIIKRLEFLDPVEKVVEELSMMEVYYHINNSGEKEMSQEISIVDITDLSERQRDSIAIVVNQIIELKPSILGVDVIFERPLSDTEADDKLANAFLSTPDDIPIVMAEKLALPNSETRTFGMVTHSFFVDGLLEEGGVNVIEKPTTNLKHYPVYLMTETDTVYSLPAKIVEILSGEKVVPDRDCEHTINYESVDFPVINYRELQENKQLITGRKVLLGAFYEERDKHLTPLGELPGIKVLAYTIHSMQQNKHIWQGSLFWIILMAVLAGYFMNAFEFLMSWLIVKVPKSRGKDISLFLKFFTESEIYDKIVAFIFMVFFTGFTYWLYAKQYIYINTWLALGTIAFIEEGRLIYKAWLVFLYKKGLTKASQHSIYYKEIKQSAEEPIEDN
jgi:hypothetical protein